MRKLTYEEMLSINGGEYTVKCSTCGYTTSDTLKIGLHGGLYPWHFWNGGHWIVLD